MPSSSDAPPGAPPAPGLSPYPPRQRQAAEAGSDGTVCRPSLRVAARGDVMVEDHPEHLAFRAAFGRVLTFRRLPAGTRAALSALGQPGYASGKPGIRQLSVGELSDAAFGRSGYPGLLHLCHHLRKLQDAGFLDHTAVDDGRPLATITGIGQYYRFTPRQLPPDEPLVLSRFAYARRDGEHLVLETPLGHARVIWHGPDGLPLLALLSAPVTPRDLAGRLPGATGRGVADVLALLASAGVVTAARPGLAAEDASPALAQWEFHDLLFHARSRHGRHLGGYGATYRHRDIQPLPAVRPVPAGPRVLLPRPDLARLAAADVPFTRVTESRRTEREFGTEPIALGQLGEFLARAAAVRSAGQLVLPRPGGGAPAAMEVTTRPYPAGGRCYELELYLTVARCTDLEPGLYHYDPLGHALTQVRPYDGPARHLMEYAAIAAPVQHPQVHITMAARFQRVSWKYQSLAYATTLKHVGVLMQTMYLVAAAMGLAACALGSGSPDMFEAAAGTGYLEEGSVGELLLGTRPEASR